MIEVQHGISFISKESNCEIMDYERSKNEDCGGWKSEFDVPERSDSRMPGNSSDAAVTIILFKPKPGSIHWSRTFGEIAVNGEAHGAEATEHAVRSFPPE